MPLTPCEFEEPEYRGPLFNQLQTTSLVWEPGQVFEKHIGIDHAMWTAHLHLHSLHGYSAPLAGASLPYHDFDYIWSARKRKKKLPSFRLNVFIQAKRPQYGRYAPKALRSKGLTSPYWRFEVTPHQQIALEKLKATLKDKALVCYACPAFHKEAILHRWTVTPQMVENSTFPDVEQLTGHSAWNFSKPGADGVANIEPTRSERSSFFDRLRKMIDQPETSDSMSPLGELQELSAAVRYAMESGGDQPSAEYARFEDGLRNVSRIVDSYLEGEERDAMVAYGTVLLFSHLNRLSWLVAGHGD